MKRLLLSLFCLMLIPCASHASAYRDRAWPLTLDVPERWRVSAVGDGNRRELAAHPKSMEDRERGDARARFTWRKAGKGDVLGRLERRYRKASGGREAADAVRLDRKRGRLEVDYRQSENVANGLWIVRRHLRVMQLGADGRQLLDADCSANASEFHRYRQDFARLCRGLRVGGGKR